MPREAQKLVRQSGFMSAEKFYILSYEGTVTEKKYFNDLRESELFNDSGTIETIPLKRSTTSGSNPLEVKKLLKRAKDEYNFRDTDEFWLIIDRDDWETIHHIDLKALAEECKKERNFFLALSNPCFEFWLILHLKDLSEFTDEERQLIYENGRISDAKHYVDTVIEQAINNGRGYNKRPDPRIFIPRTKVAIERAKALDAGGLFPSSLGTDVYKLVEKLIK